MKLKQLINNFKEKHFAIDENTLEQDFTILRNYLPQIFSTAIGGDLTNDKAYVIENFNDKIIANLRRDDDRPNFIHNQEFLPFHTHDDVWLVKYIQNVIKQNIKRDHKTQKKLNKVVKTASKNFINNNSSEDKEIVLRNCDADAKIKFGNILKFIKTDESFEKARTNYEIDLTRAQIRYMMKNRQPNNALIHHVYNRNDIHSVEILYHPSMPNHHDAADKTFRNSVVTAMTRMGLDQHSVEIGLEKYASLWREQQMTNAYYDHYDIEPSAILSLNNANWYLKVMNENFKGLWLRNREYQYYQDHKAIIDELGLATPNMKISPDKAQFTRERIELLDVQFKRILQLDENISVTKNNNEQTM